MKINSFEEFFDTFSEEEAHALIRQYTDFSGDSELFSMEYFDDIMSGTPPTQLAEAILNPASFFDIDAPYFMDSVYGLRSYSNLSDYIYDEINFPDFAAWLEENIEEEE